MTAHAFSAFTGNARPTLVELWNGRTVVARLVAGLPSFPWGAVPTGLATRRQLRAAGLRPAGQEPAGLLLWRRDARFAYLYRVDLARAVRPMTPAKWAAVRAMVAARRTCPLCHVDAGYCLPRADGRCVDCIAINRTFPIELEAAA
ncbi:RRQRL motif-containing zinc-binding protein [Kribbella sp. NPDC020789]